MTGAEQCGRGALHRHERCWGAAAGAADAPHSQAPPGFTCGCSASANVPVSRSHVREGPATWPCHTGWMMAMVPRRCRRMVGYSSSEPLLAAPAVVAAMSG
jgi:hypothetical protein